MTLDELLRKSQERVAESLQYFQVEHAPGCAVSAREIQSHLRRNRTDSEWIVREVESPYARERELKIEIRNLRAAAQGLLTAAKVAVDCHDGECYEPAAFDALQDHMDNLETVLLDEEENA